MVDLRTRLGLLVVAAFTLAACAPAAGTPEVTPAAPAGAPPTVSPATTGATPRPVPSPQPSPTAPPDGERLLVSTRGWKTDFTRHSVPLDEIVPGGPPKDGIPPIDAPVFVSTQEADEWLADQEPVIAFELDGVARAYPLQIMIWHEIVNDEVHGRPVLVTFCPLCNLALVYDRHVEGVGTLRFGTTGNLRHSDLVMWDDATESWWQQATGEAIVGALTGTKLSPLPATIVSYAAFKATYPQGQVLSRETGYERPYGRNPYVGYDDVDQRPFLFRGPIDGRLPPMLRVVVVHLGDETAVYPYTELEQLRVIADEVSGQPVVVFWEPGAVSALDQSDIAASRTIGAAGVFVPLVDGQPLTFHVVDGQIRDQETGSVWNVLGLATEGPLAGTQLEPVVHGDYFWFAVAPFYPDARVWRP